MAKQQEKLYEVQLDSNFWQYVGHTQRVTTKEWRMILLNRDDKRLMLGRMCQLKAKNLGAGVYEIRAEPID